MKNSLRFRGCFFICNPTIVVQCCSSLMYRLLYDFLECRLVLSLPWAPRVFRPLLAVTSSLSVLSSGPRKTFVLNLMIQQISYVRTYVLFVSYNASYALFRCIRFKFCAFSKMCIFSVLKNYLGMRIIVGADTF